MKTNNLLYFCKSNIIELNLPVMYVLCTSTYILSERSFPTVQSYRLSNQRYARNMSLFAHQSDKPKMFILIKSLTENMGTLQ